MKRACLAALLLVIPVFAGFECTVSAGWDLGDPCSFDVDRDNAECRSGNTLWSCDELTGIVTAYDCNTLCGGSGSCGTDTATGYEVCLCETTWEPGAVCSPLDGYSTSTCATDGELWYCDGSTALVAAWDCTAECGGAGYCDYSADLGYDWCLCDSAWAVGSACDYWSDYPAASQCYGGDALLYCGDDNSVAFWDCNDACGDSYGYCAYDDSLGYEWCLCEEDLWEPGYACSYETEYDDATCEGDMLTYCSETNVIGEISCAQQCADWYGSGVTGTCGVQPETGYNGCVCEFTGCDFDPYCNDAIYLVYCDGTDAQWLNCDTDCQAQGFSKGVCDFSASPNACQCG